MNLFNKWPNKWQKSVIKKEVKIDQKNQSPLKEVVKELKEVVEKEMKIVEENQEIIKNLKKIFDDIREKCKKIDNYIEKSSSKIKEVEEEDVLGIGNFRENLEMLKKQKGTVDEEIKKLSELEELTSETFYSLREFLGLLENASSLSDSLTSNYKNNLSEYIKNLEKREKLWRDIENDINLIRAEHLKQSVVMANIIKITESIKVEEEKELGEEPKETKLGKNLVENSEKI